MIRTVFQVRLHQLMLKAGINQKELAERTGISTSSICNYLQGTTIPNEVNLKIIADALGADPQWLVGSNLKRNRFVDRTSVDDLIDQLKTYKGFNVSDEQRENVKVLVKKYLNQQFF